MADEATYYCVIPTGYTYMDGGVNLKGDCPYIKYSS